MNRRDMLRRLAIGASGLVVAESVRDFMAWEAKRIFALGGVPGLHRFPAGIPWDERAIQEAFRRTTNEIAAAYRHETEWGAVFAMAPGGEIRTPRAAVASGRASRRR